MSDAGQLSASDPESIGVHRLLRVLGVGGQGTVYLAESPTGQQVAVKVLHARMTTDDTVVRSFRRETALAQQVAIFCTAAVLEAGFSEGRPYLVSEYVPGPSLHELVATGGPRTGSGLRRLAVATLTALEAVHRAGIVHRDFKPANVIMGPEGPVVIDFGIARILETTTATSATSSGLVGTPAYMAPEQLANQPAGPASDLFSWAATMVFAATGHPAFAGEHAAAVMGAVLGRDPDVEGVPEPLRTLLAACLAKDPRGRPALGDVLAVLTGRTPTVEPGRHIGPPADHPAGAPVGSPAPAVPLPPVPWAAAGGPAGGPAGGAADLAQQDFPGTLDLIARGPGQDGESPVAARSGSSFWRDRLGGVAAVTACVTLVALAVIFWPFAAKEPALRVSEESAAPTVDATRKPTVSPTPSPAMTPGEVGRHSDGIWAVAVGQVEGLPVAVTGSADHTVRVWDLTRRELAGEPMTGHTNDVYGVAVGQVEGRPVAVTGGADGKIRVWDLATRKPLGEPMTGHTGTVYAVAVGELEGRPVAVTGGADGSVRVWDLATHRPLGEPMTGHTDEIWAVAVGEVNGRPIAVTGSRDDSVRVWDLAAGNPLGRAMTDHAGDVYSAKVGELNGRPVAVTGGADGNIRVWDLTTRKPLGEPMTGHTHVVTSVALGKADGRPIAVTGSWDKTVRVWDLATRRPIGQPMTGHTNTVYSAAIGQADGRLFAVTGGKDTTVQLWDLHGHTRGATTGPDTAAPTRVPGSGARP
ncbi:WD domain-containing protein, G-beta repeat-containing protein [Sinosporangium album]|uniref:WD domain-containing protein, G-beta repeat-containing protein n=1 Tax=Sinosporangium album TaxID=504805 RepID=A0A1G8AAN4_9ACTN|nr:serine/threonine-protein kinase [Sinosporangium album]SDH17430.1 WD domain-containing protein, G-beta repeat-containing protein [Sinosporangium album]